MKNLCLLTAVTLASASLVGCTTPQAQTWGGSTPIGATAGPTCASGAPVKGTTVVTLSNFVDVGGQKSVTLSTDPALIEVGCWNLTWIISSGPFTFASPGITFAPALPSNQAPGFPPSYNIWIADTTAPGTFKYTIHAFVNAPGGPRWKCDPRVIATASKAPQQPSATATSAAVAGAATMNVTVPCLPE